LKRSANYIKYLVLLIIKAFELLLDSEIGPVDTPARLRPATIQVIVPQLLLFPTLKAEIGKQMYQAMWAILLGKLITPQIGYPFPSAAKALGKDKSDAWSDLSLLYQEMAL
jgi:hypothetical protein